jgi:hypothetical protein
MNWKMLAYVATEFDVNIHQKRIAELGFTHTLYFLYVIENRWYTAYYKSEVNAMKEYNRMLQHPDKYRNVKPPKEIKK